ncbi:MULTISPECIES: tail completion protein gp17 [Sphingomonadaceae]|uniref:tail completion protein gp17 n=1 Tax=Sphingomonadales TaxID=204457 RepID=UPI001CCF0C3D|nr:DUF3168 domain-containing protein [Sphingobium sp. 3R8]MBA4089519.1 hypothetical protein [Sphingobium sp.]MBZ9645929.1 DUF3168 domain-containing protein [Sphingobium sp. 3R8]
MSAEVAVRAAVIAALRADGALMDGLNGLYDGEPGRASAPYGHVGECIGADWGGKDVEGRELRLTIGLRIADETPARLAGLIGRIDPAIGQAQVQDGWRVVSARLVRSRVARDQGKPPAGWRAVIDYRLRAAREG